MKSIRHFLTLLLISSLTLVIFSAAIHGYRSSMNMSSEMFDSQLDLLHQNLSVSYLSSQRIQFHLHQPSLAIQVWQNDSLIVATDQTPNSPIAQRIQGFSDSNFSGQRWRVLTKRIANTDKWLMVGQPLADRFELAESMILAAMIPLIISLPILAVVVFLSVSRGLSPLQKLSENLSDREGNDLAIVELDDTPSELESVVTTLNSVFSRLASAFEREQQFASNAAHELRTPLSVLKINLHNLAQEFPEQAERIGALQNDADRMIHVVNQILLLSRTNPEFFKSQQTAVDFYAITQQVIADIYSRIEDKHQNIELEGQTCTIVSTEFTLYTLVQNIIGNASKYSPEGAQIRVQILQQAQQVVLVVEDSGVGIKEQEFEQVLKRFYRSKHKTSHQQEGSGLGLAIVQQIVELHHGTLNLSQSQLGGLKVRVSIPLTTREASNVDVT